MSHEAIVLVMFLGMMVLMATGQRVFAMIGFVAVSYTHLRAHETVLELVCRLLLDKNKS